MKRYEPSSSMCARSLGHTLLVPMGKMTMCISSLNIRLPWRFPSWSTVSRVSPHGVYVWFILRLQRAISVAFCGLQATLRRPVGERPCPSSVSTLNNNDRPPSRWTTATVYPRPGRTGFYGSSDNVVKLKITLAQPGPLMRRRALPALRRDLCPALSARHNHVPRPQPSPASWHQASNESA